jgi:transcriptional regulator with GAF, ATPase, and Fis domain
VDGVSSSNIDTEVAMNKETNPGLQPQINLANIERPFFNSSIQELETLFKERYGNLELLQTLQEELTHRKKKRASILRAQVTERLAVLISGFSSRESSLPVSGKSVRKKGMKNIVQTIEKTMVMEALINANWVQTEAADILGISERMLRYNMKKLGVTRKNE